MIRSFTAYPVAALLTVTLACSAFAQPPTTTAEKKTEEVQTKDGWQIPITYYPANDKEAPVVILMHGDLGGKNGNRLVWEAKGGLAEILQKQGYAVISLDLRKHGKSKHASGNTSTRLTAFDYAGMYQGDLEAVKKFILKEHQEKNLNIRKLGIVAADSSAPLALSYTLLDWMKTPYPDAPTLAARTPKGQDVRALVLLSPEDSLPRLSTTGIVRQLRDPRFGLSALIAVGSGDKKDRGKGKRMYDGLKGPTAEAETRLFYREYPTKARGSDLMRVPNLKLTGNLLVFLQKQLKELPDGWKDRTPRI